VDDPPGGELIGVWHATVRQERTRRDEWAIRISSTLDVSSDDSASAVCHSVDDACNLLREWLGRMTR
jgi:hypothetical protein